MVLSRNHSLYIACSSQTIKDFEKHILRRQRHTTYRMHHIQDFVERQPTGNPSCFLANVLVEVWNALLLPR